MNSDEDKASCITALRNQLVSRGLTSSFRDYIKRTANLSNAITYAHLEGDLIKKL